jgi:hypothetical protein
MRRLSLAGRILSLVAVSWMAAAASSAAAGIVTGTITVNGQKAALILSYVDETDEDIILVFASKDVPADAVPFIGEEVARKFKIHALVFTVSRADKKIAAGINGIFYPGPEMGYIAMAVDAPTLQLKRFDAQGIDGRIFTAKPVKLSSDTYSFDVTFSIPLGKAAPLPPKAETRITGDTTSPPALAYAEYYRAARAGDTKKMRTGLAASRVKELDTMDAKTRAMMLELIKDNPAEIRIGKPTIAGSKATLVVEGLNLQTTKTTAEVTMVQEGGAWKVDKESWKTTSK